MGTAYYIPNFISEDEETALLERIEVWHRFRACTEVPVQVQGASRVVLSPPGDGSV